MPCGSGTDWGIQHLEAPRYSLPQGPFHVRAVCFIKANVRISLPSKGELSQDNLPNLNETDQGPYYI